MATVSRFLVLLFLLASALQGCAHKGQLYGQLPASNQQATPVTFDYRSDRGGTGGKISTTLPSGESFSGNYVQITSTTQEQEVAPFFNGWSPYWNDWGPFGSPWMDAGGYPAFRTNYSDRVVATLFGDRGDTMRCRFDLKKPIAGLRGGGTGECQTSKQERIDVQF